MTNIMKGAIVKMAPLNDFENDDVIDLAAARQCLSEYTSTGNESLMEDANMCIQSIVLRRNITANPFDIDTEMDLYMSFNNELSVVDIC